MSNSLAILRLIQVGVPDVLVTFHVVVIKYPNES